MKHSFVCRDYGNSVPVRATSILGGFQEWIKSWTEIIVDTALNRVWATGPRISFNLNYPPTKEANSTIGSTSCVLFRNTKVRKTVMLLFCKSFISHEKKNIYIIKPKILKRRKKSETQELSKHSRQSPTIESEGNFLSTFA